MNSDNQIENEIYNIMNEIDIDNEEDNYFSPGISEAISPQPSVEEPQPSVEIPKPEEKGNMCGLCATTMTHVASRKCKCHAMGCRLYIATIECGMKGRTYKKEYEVTKLNNVTPLEVDNMALEMERKMKAFAEKRKLLLEQEKSGAVLEEESKPSPYQLSPPIPTSQLRGDSDGKAIPLPRDYLYTSSLFDEKPTILTPQLLTAVKNQGLLQNNETPLTLENSKDLIPTSASSLMKIDMHMAVANSGVTVDNNGLIIKTQADNTSLIAIIDEYKIQESSLAVTYENQSEVAKLLVDKQGLNMVKPFSIGAGIIAVTKDGIIAIGPPDPRTGQPGQLAGIFKNKFRMCPREPPIYRPILPTDDLQQALSEDPLLTIKNIDPMKFLEEFAHKPDSSAKEDIVPINKLEIVGKECAGTDSGKMVKNIGPLFTYVNKTLELIMSIPKWMYKVTTPIVDTISSLSVSIRVKAIDLISHLF